MQLSNNTLLQICVSGIVKTIMMLVVLTLSATSINAQVPIKKPEKKKQTTTTTTTTQHKPRTNTSTSSKSSSSNSTTTSATKSTTGTINGHEYVDLGLSVKWATCNVGASSPSDYGNYYAWGETSTKSVYTEGISKTSGMSMGSIAGNPTYDTARANWGGTWRLPTTSEISELIHKCTWIWTTQGSHNGYKVTGANGNSIFLPAAGSRNGTSFYSVGEYGAYWSATPNEGDRRTAYDLCFANAYSGGLGNYPRYCGRSVRPVSE